MSLLRISLFGGARVVHDGVSLSSQLKRAIEALLAFLVLQRYRSHHREVLAGLLWEDQPDDPAHAVA